MKIKFKNEIYEKNKSVKSDMGKGLGRLCLKIFEEFLLKEKNKTYKELQNIFNTEKIHKNFSTQGSAKKVIFNEEDFKNWYENNTNDDTKRDDRYFGFGGYSEPIKYNNEKLYFTTQWGKIEICNMIDFAKKNSFDIEIIEDIQIRGNNTKNIILYGSPGVGKTHNTNKLIKLIEDDKSDREIFEAIKKNEKSDSVDISDIKERVKFVTFHQSFGYEDFIEGFRPNEEGKIELADGVFKSICDKARENTISSNISTALSEEIKYISDKPKIWKLSLGAGGEIKKECFSENCIRLGWDNYGDLDSADTIKQRELKDFYNLEIGDIIFAFKNQWEIDGIGIVIGNYTFEDSYSKYKHKRDVKWVIKNKVINIKDFNANTRMTLSTLYKLNRISKQDVLEILKDNQDEVVTDNSDPKNYYLVIDEINRGNISKIFGELITLIEENKRDNLEVSLPYSKQPFKIPSNLYIIGTMNSTDKSIALIDIALRRRFTFLKMKPNAELIIFDKAKEIFIALNEQITKDLGEDYQIGHSYFMKIENEDELDFVLDYKIIPLLEEYYYGDDRFDEVAKICKNEK